MSCITMLAGAPGSGKSFIAQNLFPAGAVLNRDWMREKISDLPNDRRPTTLYRANAIVYQIADARLEAGRSVLVDSTGLQPVLNTGLASLASAWDAKFRLAIVRTPLQVCIRRNNEHEASRIVPSQVVRSMHSQIEDLIQQTADDSSPWDEVAVVSGESLLSTIEDALAPWIKVY